MSARSSCLIGVVASLMCGASAAIVTGQSCTPAGTTLALKWNSYASEWGAYEITGCTGVNPKLSLAAGTTYTFDQSDASNWCAPHAQHVPEFALHCLCLWPLPNPMS